jgi:hypothetical protein
VRIIEQLGSDAVAKASCADFKFHLRMPDPKILEEGPISIFSSVFDPLVRTAPVASLLTIDYACILDLIWAVLGVRFEVTAARTSAPKAAHQLYHSLGPSRFLRGGIEFLNSTAFSLPSTKVPQGFSQGVKIFLITGVRIDFR